MKTTYLYALLFLMVANSLFAQKEQTHWYMGIRYGMKFENGQRQVLPPHPDNSVGDFDLSVRHNACISHPKTGEFLFQANGARVLDKNFMIMPGGKNSIEAIYSMIVQNAADSSKYYIIYALNKTIYYAEVNMRLRNGLGDVTFYDRLIRTNALEYFTIVRNQTGLGHWIITHTDRSTEYQSFPINSGIIQPSKVVKSIAGDSAVNDWPDSYQGNMVSDKTGSLIAHAYHEPNAILIVSNLVHIDILSFDKCRGIIKLNKKLSSLPTSPDFVTTQASVAFSLTGKYIFVSLVMVNAVVIVPAPKPRQEIIRYDFTSTDPNATRASIAKFASYHLHMKQITLAPDGDIYVTTSDSDKVSTAPLNWHISVVKNSENSAPSFSYKAFPFLPSIAPTIYPTFPPFMMDTAKNNIPKAKLIYGCVDDSVKLTPPDISDSVSWNMGDGNSIFSRFGSYLYKNSGKYTVTLNHNVCGQPITDKYSIVVAPRVLVDLGPDTILCHGVKYNLNAEKDLTSYQWSTGDKTDGITATKPGRYWAFATNGICKDSDTVDIQYNPQIWVKLGKEFSLCESDSQTVKLDAGKGFEEYLWTPTGDTTQWIIVKKAGPYFVIVKDFLGCAGDDGTVIKHRCNVENEIPNAFSPNGDGLNDVFAPYAQYTLEYRLTIYNRWGEVLFFTSNPQQGWDGSYKGSPAQEGVYFYDIHYSGYVNNLTRKFNKNGVLHLMR